MYYSSSGVAMMPIARVDIIPDEELGGSKEESSSLGFSYANSRRRTIPSNFSESPFSFDGLNTFFVGRRKMENQVDRLVEKTWSKHQIIVTSLL